MKLDGEQNGSSFYDGGGAPEEAAAADVGPGAVMVNETVDVKSVRTQAAPAAEAAEPEAPPPLPPPPAPPPPAAPPPMFPAPDVNELRPDLTIALERTFNEVKGREEFRLLRRIGYDDDAPKGVGTILVPSDLENWTTDLTSVPSYLTWLVPKTGAHLPAAILHDGLVLDADETASYIANCVIERDQADRIFRDAMAKTGTGVIRRWLIWAAVTTATMHHGRQVKWTPIQKWHYRFALWGTLLAILLLGIWSTLDLLDIGGPGVPWIGENPWQALIGGISGAIVIPLLLGLTWGKFRIAGWIIGPLVALIVPAILPIVLIGTAFVAADRLQRWRPGLAKALAAAVIAAAFVAFILSWYTT
ncbi:DUF1353 domain-containing protein [Nocardia sp. NPDC051030]|uniref:DUF1353 domain-containing protein n=1 Tax=Nocardia sp. NPDC051030 TaxID=3155162 RepID=UPI0034218751